MQWKRGCSAATVAVTLALTSCATDRDDSLAARQAITTTTIAPSAQIYPANGDIETVDALDNNFRPQVLTIRAGTAVEFVNVGRNVHNVVPADDKTATTWGVLDAGFQPKGTYTYVFTRPGTYQYYCTIHGTPTAAMFGTINVTAP